MKTAGEIYREELRNEGMKAGKQEVFRMLMFVKSSRRRHRSDAEIRQSLMEDFKLTSDEAKVLVGR